MNSDDTSMRFMMEQVSRQYQDLKVDLRTEMAVLRKDLTREFRRQDDNVKELKAETDQRFMLMDERLLEVQTFKWRVVGALSLVVFAAELIMRLLIK